MKKDSKEKLFEMFEKVNKINLKEDLADNKFIESNNINEGTKDKLFTVEDISWAWDMGKYYSDDTTLEDWLRKNYGVDLDGDSI